jgi:DNA-binding CsgD family transcriptional regulator
MVAQLVTQLSSDRGDGVLLVGQPGVGSTRVLDEVLARLGEGRRVVHRIVASDATRAVPFGALAHVLPGSLGEPLDLVVMFDRLRAAIGTPSPTQRAVFGVDDIPHLDDASLGLLTQLITAGLAVVIATLHDAQLVPAALATIERSCRTERATVAPLSRAHTLLLLDQALAGSIDGHSALTLADTSQGHPGFLAEIVEGSIASGALAQVIGAWTLRGEPAVTDRLAQTFERWTVDLTDAGRDLLELLALAEPVSLDSLDSAGLIDGATALEAAGLITVVAANGGSASVRITQPLMAMQWRARMSPLRRRALLPRAIGLIGADPIGDDVLRVAQWKLETGQAVDVSTLEQAAAIARARNDFETTEVLASAAARQDPTLGTLLLQSEALHDLCRFEDADVAMQRAAALVTDDMSLLRLAVVRHRLQLWGRHDAAGSVAVLRDAHARLGHPTLRDFVLVALANTVAFSGGLAEVPGIVADVPADSELAQIALMFPRTIEALFTGRVDEAVELGRDGCAQRARHQSHHYIGPPELFGLAHGLALLESGRFAEAEEVLGRAYEDVVEQRVPQSHTWLATARGKNELQQGHITEARSWFVEARSVAERARFTPGMRVALTGLMVCSAHQQDLDTARSALRAFVELPSDHGLLWPERTLGLAWVDAAEGRLDAAVRVLIDGADEATVRSEHLLATELLYEAARMGGARTVLAAFAVAAARCDGALVAARSAFVRGVAAGDHHLLATAERAFARMGAWLGAAESASELGRVLAALGRPRDAQGAAARSVQYCSDLGTVVTPLLASGPTVELSPREGEIARLAADGVASKVIAQQLGLSVRTVSNHLQNAYLKLGISGRDDLADALSTR